MIRTWFNPQFDHPSGGWPRDCAVLFQAGHVGSHCDDDQRGPTVTLYEKCRRTYTVCGLEPILRASFMKLCCEIGHSHYFILFYYDIILWSILLLCSPNLLQMKTVEFDMPKPVFVHKKKTEPASLGSWKSIWCSCLCPFFFHPGHRHIGWKRDPKQQWKLNMIAILPV